jgi:hypothetical protein
MEQARKERGAKPGEEWAPVGQAKSRETGPVKGWAVAVVEGVVSDDRAQPSLRIPVNKTINK